MLFVRHWGSAARRSFSVMTASSWSHEASTTAWSTSLRTERALEKSFEVRRRSSTPASASSLQATVKPRRQAIDSRISASSSGV